MNSPIVIDNGSGTIKAGFAGTDAPKAVFRSCVGRTKLSRIMPGGALEGNEVFVGSKVDEHKGVLSITYPMEHGVVTDWSDMERIWTYVYSKEHLNVASEEHAVLLTEAPLNPFANREKSAEIFFEGMNVPALYVAMQATMSLYATGRTSGLVLDSGDGVTHAVPIYEGFALPHAIVRIDLAGRDITNNLTLLLRRSGYNFNSSAEVELVRQIKEKCCFVASGHKAAAAATSTSTSQGSKMELTSGPTAATLQYQLPDGSYINIGKEAHLAPEILFRPDLVCSEYRGVHDCVVKAITKSDMTLRKTLYSQIVLSGGSTMFNGFGERLLAEMRRHPLTPKDAKIVIAAPPERVFTTWIGGSILASLSSFRSTMYTKKDYLEQGARILMDSKL